MLLKEILPMLIVLNCGECYTTDMTGNGRSALRKISLKEEEGMRRYFNTEGICRPQIHYMVRLDERLEKIRRRYIERGSYFVINRGRQYGKTTTLRALAEYLKPEYIVISLDFQEIGSAEFKDEAVFSKAFAEILMKACRNGEKTENTEELLQPLNCFLKGTENIMMREMFEQLSGICARATKPIVLMIDEVDSASNHQVFLDFLALLRGYYLNRENTPTFHSVILAGVYDIKNLKLKLRPDSEHKYNSPWNIAADFDINMDLGVDKIASMLREYETDNCTGMNIQEISESIFEYTNGYPYLVSLICKILDERIPEIKGFEKAEDVWTKKGVAEAVKIVLNKTSVPLFDSMIKQLDTFSDLRDMIEEILYQGKRIPFSPYVKSVNLGVMFGFLKEEDGRVAVANRIFEMGLLNMFMTEEAAHSEAFRYGQRDSSQFIDDGHLNMRRVLEKFVLHFADIYGENDEKFIEAYGRKFFLLYLKPIINGTGNYYLEAQTRDARRTDVIVDYRGEQFIVELKIWHGSEYNERGEAQLVDYLDYYHVEKGYMLSFNFNKKKETGVKEIRVGGRTIVEAVV